MRHLLFIVTLAVLFLGCSSFSADEANLDALPLQLIHDLEAFDRGAAQAVPFVVRSATITGNVLHLEFEHSSSCADPSFALYSTYGIYYSNPPQAAVYPSLVANQSECPEVVVETIRFDLSALREAGYNDIGLRIYGFEEDEPVQPVPFYRN